MKIKKGNDDISIILNGNMFIKSDLGWEESFSEYEDEALRAIINPISNYETTQFLHEPYEISGYTGNTQDTIWYQFYFLNGGLYVSDYEPTGLSAKENALMLKQTTKSFFTLEFYRTIDNNPPDRVNRRLAFRKKLALPLGEKYFYTPLNDYIFKPAFSGSSFRNKENMTLFWLKDKDLGNVDLTTETLWFTAKFYNAEDGSIMDFTNRDISNPFVEKRYGISGEPIKFYQKDTSITGLTESDLYYKITLNWENYTYVVE